MRHTINIFYFPRGLRITAWLLFIEAAHLTYQGYYTWAIVIALVFLFTMTAKYVTIIDSESRNFIDAFGFFWLRITREKQSYRHLDKIIITKGNYSQKVTTRTSDRQFNWSDYTGTLIYDQSGELELLTRESKKELVDALRVYATALQIDIEDHSISSSSRSLA